MTAAATPVPVKPVNRTLERARRARRGVRTRIIVSLAVIGVVAVASIVVPMLYHYVPVSTNLIDRLKAPGSVLQNGTSAWLGTDQIGRDMLPNMMAGARMSLTVGAATLVISGAIGVLLGLLAGHFGGWLDTVLMRLADIQLAFPSILLAILMAAVLGQGVGNVIIVLSISNWVVFARVARSQVLALKNLEYVEAARTLGASNAHLMFRTLLPGCVAPVLVVTTTQFGQVVLAESSLSFLGVGMPVGTPSLGSTIHDGVQYLSSQGWWISVFPGIVLLIVVLAFGILGDALRDRFDPRLRSA
jgi:peptide/nickel transport system permease protein